MTEKRFHKAYCCGDTGVVDKVKNEWFIENINSISDIEKNWDNVIDKLNQVAEENEQLKSVNMEMEDCLGRLEESNINLRIKLKKIRDYAKEDGEVKQGIIEKVILND